MKSKWSEIRNHNDELAGWAPAYDMVRCITIDAYPDNTDATPGEVIAKVFQTKRGDVGVVYLNNAARTDEYAQEVIRETIVELQDGLICVDEKAEVRYPGVTVQLPDGRALHASKKDDPDYPGIKVALANEGEKPENCEAIVWAEYNVGRDDYTDEQRLRILAWDAKHQDYVVNLGYDTGEFERDSRNGTYDTCKHCGGEAEPVCETDDDGDPCELVRCQECGVQTDGYLSYPGQPSGDELARRAWNRSARP